MKNFVSLILISFLASCSTSKLSTQRDAHPQINKKHPSVHTSTTQNQPITLNALKRTIPKGKTGKIISREGYVLQYNKDCKIAHWASYEILSENLIGDFKRQNDFAPDELIDSDQANLEDYKYSGYDRGHLARAHLFTRSNKLMSESFRLSNIVPQDPYMNESGAWRRSEDFEYDVARNSGKILVVSGPILAANPKVIGPNKVCVPQSLFKVILNPETKKGIGFIIPNQKEKNKYHYYVKTIDEVENASGLDFFHELDDSIEKKIENEADISKWDNSAKAATQYIHPKLPNPSSDQDPPYKKSLSGKCHAKGTRYYKQTKHFASFNTLEECLN